MDPITHGVLGATVAQLCLYKKDKHNAWIVGALAAMAPDLDVLIRSEQNPMLLLLYHRHFTHSLLFIPFGALVVTLALMLFKRFRVHWQLTFIAALIGYSTHGLLDALTSYGTLLYWPFSDQRVSWDIVSIVDPLVTIPLILGLIWSKKFNSVKGLWVSLLFVGLFFIGNGVQHERALNQLDKYASKHQLHFDKMRAHPKLASSTQWLGIATAGTQFYAFNILTPLWHDAQINKVNQHVLFDSNLLSENVKKSPHLMQDLALFTWFSGNYLIVLKENPLTLGDGRFLLGKNASRVLWAIQFDPNKPHVDMSSWMKSAP